MSPWPPPEEEPLSDEERAGVWVAHYAAANRHPHDADGDPLAAGDGHATREWQRARAGCVLNHHDVVILRQQLFPARFQAQLQRITRTRGAGLLFALNRADQPGSNPLAAARLAILWARAEAGRPECSLAPGERWQRNELPLSWHNLPRGPGPEMVCVVEGLRHALAVRELVAWRDGAANVCRLPSAAVVGLQRAQDAVPWVPALLAREPRAVVILRTLDAWQAAERDHALGHAADLLSDAGCAVVDVDHQRLGTPGRGIADLAARDGPFRVQEQLWATIAGQYQAAQVAEAAA